MTNLEDRYGNLTTEQPNPDSTNLDLLSPIEFLELMQKEDFRVLDALARVQDELGCLIEELAERFRAGGRLFYTGAGTSGRLGMLDAVECPPTFGTDPELVQTLLAGGYECLVRSVEGAEDDTRAGTVAVGERGITDKDLVLGIAASGVTPFVRSVLKEATRRGALTVLLKCHEGAVPGLETKRIIPLLTGPEVLTGSTRLKAGTATKMFLNRLTTGAMIQIGKVYQNRMVDLYLTCDKLRERAIRTTREMTGLSREEAVELLQRVGGSVKAAILSHKLGTTPEEASSRLASHRGNLRQALERC